MTISISNILIMIHYLWDKVSIVNKKWLPQRFPTTSSSSPTTQNLSLQTIWLIKSIIFWWNGIWVKIWPSSTFESFTRRLFLSKCSILNCNKISSNWKSKAFFKIVSDINNTEWRITKKFIEILATNYFVISIELWNLIHHAVLTRGKRFFGE